MGTRADFYIGRGKSAKWVGSVGYDGYPTGLSVAIFEAKTEKEYEHALEGMSLVRGDFTRPREGWPWPWKDSNTSDYAYAFDKGRVWVSHFGGAWLDAKPYVDFTGKEAEGTMVKKLRSVIDSDEYLRSKGTAIFPDMSARMNITYGPRSGIIVLGNIPTERISPEGAPEIRGIAETKPSKRFQPGRRRPVKVRTHQRRRHQK